MPRLVSVWLPDWPIERMRRAQSAGGPGHADIPPCTGEGREAPFALVEAGVHGLTLTAVNGRARAEGLRCGQALADARAALPALLTRPAERELDRAALAALARWCGRYGPRRNVDGEDGIWIDITGVAHLFGGEAHLLADLLQRLSGFGLTARVGLADTMGAASACARYATGARQPTLIAPPDGMSAALAGLPVEGLRLEPDIVLLLKRLGLRRIGQLEDLARGALAQRFRSASPGRAGRRSERAERAAVGRAGAVLARLDQALGRAGEPLVPLEEPPAHIVRRAFAEPLISAEGVAAAAGLLVDEIGRLLDAGGVGASRFALCLYRADGSAAEVRIGTSTPSRDSSHLLRLLSERLDRIDAGFGIDVMTFAATEAAPLGAHQAALPVRDRGLARSDPAALVDRLANRLGGRAVVRLAAADSHIPERAERRQPALAAGPARRAPGNGALAARPARRWPPDSRPAFLLGRPEPIAVVAEVPEGPPLVFTWRRLRHRIVRSEGPERIEPDWWREIGRVPSAPRDYYRIEDAGGGRYWVFRAGRYGDDAEAGPPRWFLHGLYG